MNRADITVSYIVEEDGSGTLELNREGRSPQFYDIPPGQTYSRLEEHFQRLIHELCRLTKTPAKS